MLNQKDAVATIAVRSVAKVRDFYEKTLGLTPAETREKGVLTFTSGRSSLFVYESEFAGTNKATAATWVVGDDLDTIVETLRGRGVTFEHYDLPGTTRTGDIHEAGTTRVAWLKDPEGNILSLVNG